MKPLKPWMKSTLYFILLWLFIWISVILITGCSFVLENKVVIGDTVKKATVIHAESKPKRN